MNRAQESQNVSPTRNKCHRTIETRYLFGSFRARPWRVQGKHLVTSTAEKFMEISDHLAKGIFFVSPAGDTFYEIEGATRLIYYFPNGSSLPQLQRARLAGEKLTNSREFRTRVFYLAGASFTPDLPRYLPHKNSQEWSPVRRVRMRNSHDLRRTESKLIYHNYLFYQKDTARPLSRLLIHTQLKKKNPEEDE